MKPEILIALVRAAEQGLSKRQASQTLDIQYQTVLKYSKKYVLKFICERRRVNEKRREERIERERGGSDPKNVATIEDNDRSIGSEPEAKSETELRRAECITPNSRAAIDRKLKLSLSQAKSVYEKAEVKYWYKWICFEHDLIRRKKRPGFPVPRVEGWQHANFAKRESLDRRGRILNSLQKMPRTTSQISEITGFDVRSTALFMHNLFREGKVDRSIVIPPGGSKKNRVYLYAQAGEMQ
jgi:hypothetical protein